MDSSSTLLAVILGAITAGGLLIFLGLGINNLILLRIGVRNIVRRPSQTMILLCGLALSTVVITAAFGLSDSFTNSAITNRLAKMGNVDESITGPFTQAQINSTLAHLRQNKDVQAASEVGIYPRSPSVLSMRTGFSVANVDFYAVPPEFDQVYGSLTNSQGQRIHFADLGLNDVFVSPTLAQNLGVQPGDVVRISFGSNETATRTVRTLLSKDIGVTTGEAIADSSPELFMSLVSAQHIDSQPPDAICIQNVRSNGTAQSAATQSPAVISSLQQLFPGISASLDAPHALGITTFDDFRIHPLNPDVVERTAGLININKLVFLSSAGQQFSWLPPLFTCLLVGAGMLLLVLLIILLAAERRTELGMSRALGLQRSHLIQLFLFEGCGYAFLASSIGILIGIGATALEIVALSFLPALSAGEAGNAVASSVISSGSLHLWISWQSLLSSWSIGILTTLITIGGTAIWISRTNIVAAIRGLDDPLRSRTSLATLWHTLWYPPTDADGDAIPETAARQRARRLDTIGNLLWGVWARGPLCLLVSGILFALSNTQESHWLRQLAMVFLISGIGLLGGWFLPSIGISARLARRVCFSFIGLGWLIVDLLLGNTFLALFQPIISFSGAPSLPELFLNMLLPVVGAVVLVMTNIDIPIMLTMSLLRRIRALAPISGTSLVYPLTFRFRTGVTAMLLSLITFLVLLLVTTNLGSIQEAQAAANQGGYQLETDIFGSQLDRDSTMTRQLQALQNHALLGQDFASIGQLHMMYDFPQTGLPQPIRVNLASQENYSISKPPMVANNAFLADTTLPLYARAQGFTSDRQIWDTVLNRAGYVVLQYDAQIPGLPTTNGFAPFTAELPDSSLANAHFHQVTVIGLVPASTPWRVLISEQTAGMIKQPPYIPFINTYLFRLRSGVSETQAAQDLNSTLGASRKGITIQSLDQASLNGVTAIFTLFLGSYLALGLLFGALAIGVIASRAVVERRQQIGMLRALGFPRRLVRRSFLLESSYIIAIGLFVGAALALWFALQIARSTYRDFPVPIIPIVLILLGSFLIAFISTTLPARQAVRVHPAEALRYE